MAGVTSGLGRHGPWLQNAWLRVETRQDDGTISPVALDGAFRPVERASAYVRFAGGAAALARADYDIQPHHDALGAGRCLVLTARDPQQALVLRREVVLYDAHPFAVTRLGVTNESPLALRVASLHPFASGEGRARVRFAGKPDRWSVYRNGWQSWAPTMSLGGTQSDLRSAPPITAPEPPLRDPGQFASDDVAVLHDPSSGRSLLCGAVTARAYLTQVAIDVPARAVDARCLADGITLEPGATLWSERIAIDVTGGASEQLERYGDALGRLMGARVPARQPSGWCSWYYFFTAVTEDDVVRNLRFLEQHRREMPVDCVQIDDGYQADIGDWLTVNEKFPHGMAWLASEIKRAGYTPGLWLAPFLLSESSRTFADHPDWVVRDDDGAPVMAMHNWNHANYGLDTTLPPAEAWLTDLFRAICDGWGYEYVKIDFLFGAAIAGHRHDPSATRAMAYRRALDAVRAGTGDGRFVLGCGSLMAPSVGYFDGNRIGNDVAPWWRFMSGEARARPVPPPRTPDDALSAEVAVRNTMTRWWMHNRLWANDPDCMLVRTDRTKLTFDETRSLAATIALSGGMMLSSDDLTTVPPDRLHILSMMLPALPRSATPIDLMERDMPERFEYADARAFDPLTVIGAFNFDDVARDVSVALPAGRWDAFELWGERYLGVAEGEVVFTLVEPHGCRVLSLRPAGDGVRLVGSTAHVGSGALEITGVERDAQRLRIALAPPGRRVRRLYFAGGRPRAATLDGRDVAIADAPGGATFVEVTVDSPATLEVAL